MLYGNLDGPTGNNKPLYANTNTVFGVTASEAANTLGHGKRVAHAGWNQQTIGKGYVKEIRIITAGQGINANGVLILTGGGFTLNANATYVVNNSFSNSALNVVSAVVVGFGGTDYTSTPNVTFMGANTVLPTFEVVMGGRANRVYYETLVASGSMQGDSQDTTANTYFPGN